MAEAITGRNVLAFVWALLACGTVVSLIGAAGSVASPARASMATVSNAPGKRPLPPPPGFRLQASNGYSFIAFWAPSGDGRQAAVELIVTRKRQRVTYAAPATVTETSIQANLGELGEIAVAFRPTGQARKVRSRCGGRPVSIDSGSYEGTITFHGEEGYTELDATSAPGNIDFLVDSLCGVSVGGGTGGSQRPGAELHIRNPQLGPELTAIKDRPDGAALIGVGVSEYNNEISIHRSVSLSIPTSGFTYDRLLQTATLSPPAPFSGTGQFDRTKKGSKRWSGDLMVDMPGREGVPLTGPLLRPTLVPAGSMAGPRGTIFNRAG
jgi:hypothetical protein